MALFASLLAGLIFGVGLIVSGMVNPAKVLAFLDLAGQWDPSLALVMAGAVAVGVLGFAAANPRQWSLIGVAMRLPAAQPIERRVLIGSALFGVGWGIAGFCPGAALVAIVPGGFKALVFVVAMLFGMGAFELLGWRRQRGALGTG